MTETGQTLGPYQLEDALGGTRSVFRARHLESGDVVCVKLLPEHLRLDAINRGRRKRELLATRHVRHEGLGRPIDFVDHGGRLFLVMEYVDGAPLSMALFGGVTLAPSRALRVVRGAAEAVAAAHAAYATHGCLEPDKVLLDAEGGIHVVGFGFRDEDALKHPGPEDPADVDLCTAPERWSGAFETPEADVWALGALLYRCLTGVYPFEASTRAELSHQVQTGDVVPPAFEAGPVEKPAIEAVVLRALSRDPTLRYPDAAVLARALVELEAMVPPEPEAEEGPSFVDDADIELLTVDEPPPPPPDEEALAALADLEDAIQSHEAFVDPFASPLSSAPELGVAVGPPIGDDEDEAADDESTRIDRSPSDATTVEAPSLDDTTVERSSLEVPSLALRSLEGSLPVPPSLEGPSLAESLPEPPALELPVPEPPPLEPRVPEPPALEPAFLEAPSLEPPSELPSERAPLESREDDFAVELGEVEVEAQREAAVAIELEEEPAPEPAPPLLMGLPPPASPPPEEQTVMSAPPARAEKPAPRSRGALVAAALLLLVAAAAFVVVDPLGLGLLEGVTRSEAPTALATALPESAAPEPQEPEAPRESAPEPVAAPDEEGAAAIPDAGAHALDAEADAGAADEGSDEDERAQEAADESADAADERVDEADEEVAALPPKEAYAAATKALTKALEERGILWKDDRKLDSLRLRAIRQAKAGRYADATRAAEEALEVAAGVQIDDKVVRRKLLRYVQRRKQIQNGDIGKRALALETSARKHLKDGEPEKANELLNTGLRLMYRAD